MRFSSALPRPVLTAFAIIFAIVLLGSPFSLLGQEAEVEDDFKIIVHVRNPISSMEQSRISKIFLKKIKSWKKGGRIVAFDLAEDSEVRKSFTQAIHGKSTTAIDSYWQRMIFSGRDVPPEKVESEEEMIENVAANVRAIGYVSAQADLPESLKVLEVTTK